MSKKTYDHKNLNSKTLLDLSPHLYTYNWSLKS